MADENISSPVTPEVTKLDEVHSRRNSTGKIISSNSQDKVLSRYLRASTGSCHDFCKYGKKHAFEEKARHAIPKRIAKPHCDKQSSVESMESPQRKKTPRAIPRSASNTGAFYHDTSDITKQEAQGKSPKEIPIKHGNLPITEKTSVVKFKPSQSAKSRLSYVSKSMKKCGSSPSTKVQASLPNASSQSGEKSLSTEHATLLKLRSAEEKLQSSLNTSGGKIVHRINEIKTGKRAVTSKAAVKKILALPTASSSPRPSAGRAASLTTRRESLKIVSTLNQQNGTKEGESEKPNEEIKERNSDAIEEKTLYVIKMDMENTAVESDKNESCAVESPPSSPSPFRSPPPPAPPSSSLDSISLPTSPSLSPHNEEDEGESAYTVSEEEDGSLSEYGEDLDYEETETLEGEKEGRPRRTGMVSSEGKDDQHVKLRFRRGKVVDVPSENSSPRRLKFRRGRIVGEHQNTKAEVRRSYRRREVDGDANDDETHGEKVVLRHQDVQGKKNEKGLFNNVIEETASKLVQARKSKVKALVGAFETVISLQDKKKPSADDVTSPGNEVH